MCVSITFFYDYYSFSFFHDFLLLSRIAFLHHFFEQLKWEPCDQSKQSHLEQEWSIDVADLEVLSEERNTADVGNHSQNNGNDHLALDLGHFRQHIQHLDTDQSWERDRHDIDEWLVELGDGNEHNQACLKYNKTRKN